MHNLPQKCGYTGKVTYTALHPWELSVIRNAGPCFTGTNMDFVLWNQTKYFVRHVTCHNLLFLLAWMMLLRAEPLGFPFSFSLLLLLPLKWRCCLLGLKLIYALTEEEVYCSAQRKNSKKQSENKGWFLINHNIFALSAIRNKLVHLPSRTWDTSIRHCSRTHKFGFI